jgi:hypothetical protein
MLQTLCKSYNILKLAKSMGVAGKKKNQTSRSLSPLIWTKERERKKIPGDNRGIRDINNL